MEEKILDILKNNDALTVEALEEKLGFNFIYGADKIYSPNEFLNEINELAKENLLNDKI